MHNNKQYPLKKQNIATFSASVANWIFDGQKRELCHHNASDLELATLAKKIFFLYPCHSVSVGAKKYQEVCHCFCWKLSCMV